MNGRQSIRQQLQWLGVVPALIMLILLLGALTWQRFDDAESELAGKGVFTVQYLASAAEYGVLSGNLNDLRYQARLAFQQPDVVFVEFRNTSGDVILHVDRSALSAGEATPRGQVREFHAAIYRQPLAMTAPLGEQSVDEGVPDRVGEVTVGLSDQFVVARQREILLASLAPAVLAILAGLWIARGMAVRLSRPLIELSQLVQKIRGGDFQARGGMALHGELATLQADINQLAAELEQARREQDDAMHALREARARAESASHAKSEFLAMMSHELRTPMNGVLGMLQLLELSELDREQAGYARAAVESTGHLLDVINDILDFSRIESGRLEIEHLYFPVTSMVENAAASVRFAAEQKHLAFRVEGLDALADVQVAGDPTRMRQVITNLLSNAVKFTESGHVVLRLSAEYLMGDKLRLCFEVEDSGIGIPEEKLPGLFDAFSQVDTSTSRRFGGTGLGLAIVRRLMDLMGGELAVHSEVGKGTVFAGAMTMPWRAAAAESVTQQPEGGKVALHGRLLLVEDNDVNRLVAQHMLEGVGLQVDVAVDGRLALDRLHAHRYDCVLMDIQMPVMDGMEAVRLWRQHERTEGEGHTPIIALTANALAGERERCLDAGMDDYLAKPFQRDGLLAMISRYLKPA
ncbi:MAG: ATP-binding protein [Alcanivoracaceae bacterium]|nr:ATP-binding protein [Alcanivoracaceae bacterium]